MFARIKIIKNKKYFYSCKHMNAPCAVAEEEKMKVKFFL
jgi:hypothetical protein